MEESDICSRSPEVNYFYNASSSSSGGKGRCIPRHFSICSPDMNRFETESACMAVCGSFSSSSSNMGDINDKSSEREGERESSDLRRMGETGMEKESVIDNRGSSSK